jgi:hypothetical protein
MTSQCKCGGRLKRTDIFRTNDGFYQDSDPKVSHWKCDKCGITRIQGKRQPKVLMSIK